MAEKLEDLKSVLADLEKASGADRGLDLMIARFVLGRNVGVPALTKSLDAAIALVERVLPGATYEVTTTGMRPGASILAGAGIGAGAYAPTPPLALLTALFRV